MRDDLIKKKWMVHSKKADFEGISKRFGIDPVTARILRNRDIVSEKEIDMFLNGSLSDLYDASLLPDGVKAAELIAQKIREGKKIRIVGDYDVDGVCSTYILSDTLKNLGADVTEAIPDRILDGYGINERIVDGCIEDGIDTIITCDNGISAYDALKKAKDRGITIILTDHHDIRTDEDGSEILPEADTITNAKLKASEYPESEICGAVTAWKMAGLIYKAMGRSEGENLKYLEFAAIATVCDVMSLKGENRIIVKEGLKALSRGAVNTGIRALIDVNELKKEITCYHLGFVLGPCINAAGRLENAKKALELFNAASYEEAVDRAQYLKELNDSRKLMTENGVAEALNVVKAEKEDKKILVVYLPKLHESLAGIVAGKVKEHYNRPTIVLTDSENDDSVIKGSGRSIDTWNMFENLLKCEDLMLKFGGHPTAAGMSLKRDNLEALEKRLNDNCTLTDEDMELKIWIDVPMPMSYVTEELIGELAKLEPFGNGNPKPVFAEKNVHPANMRVMGKLRNALKADLYTSDGAIIKGIAFGDGDSVREDFANSKNFSILYYPQINEYNGLRSIQVVIEDYL
ncbi:MAG: single-stranded-DNA-specific exonuclease RecJ [Eubacteriales bacterium]|nr:single-stranded-DNA-specific exonuclease RecJ [Eubacteriales bacterium]